MLIKEDVQEWLDSAVDQSLIELNVVSLERLEAYDRLLYGIPHSERRNDGRLRDKWLKRYRHCEDGGWWVSGVDILEETFSDDLWGQYKPKHPRINSDRRKPIKYEAPLKQPTGIFAFKVPLFIWQAIATRFDVPMPENIKVTPEGRAWGFWAWVIANPQIPVIITEGAKKAGAIITANYVVIALPGVYNGYRQPKDRNGKKNGKAHLIPQLKAFAQKDREIIFCFDKDAKSTTVKNVNTAIAKTGKLFMAEGCRVSRITWDYPEKGVDDLIAARGKECFDELYQARSPLPKSDLSELLDLSKYEPVKIDQQYLDDTIIPPESAQIIALKSPKGTNKTGWLGEVTAKATYHGKPVLVLTHRIQLTKELCDRFGIDHIDEVRKSETRGMLGYGFCIDSLHRNSQTQFNPDNWDGAIVVLDEIEQTLWHALNSKTCEKNRIAIIKNLQTLLKNVIETGGKIYLSDADLSTISIDYIHQLIKTSVETWVLENNYIPNQKRELVSYSGNDPSNLVHDLIKSLENGEKAFIQTTGQKANSKWGTINLESYLTKKFPDLKILRIDGESVTEKNHPACGCMANLDFVLAQYDVVVASPVIETGVSIDIKGHFDRVWAIAYGLQTVDAVCQTVARLRDDVPRHIWAKKTAKGNCVGNGSTYVSSLLTSENQKAAANIRQLHLAGINEFDELDINPSPHSLSAWAKRACTVNEGRANYRDEIINKLLQEGYELFTPDEENLAKTVIKQEVKDNCQENYRAHSKAVAEADIPSNSELEELKDKKAKTKTERLQEKKGNLVKKYGVEVTPELVEKDDNGLYSKLQLHFFLTVGKSKLAERDKKTLAQLSKDGDGQVFAPDLNRKQLSAKVKALQIIGIEQFLDPEAEFSKSSLSEWFSFIIQHRFEIKAILGVSVNPKTDNPIKVAQRFLKKLGLKLVKKHWRGSRITRQRQYCVIDPYENQRSQIFEYWFAGKSC